MSKVNNKINSQDKQNSIQNIKGQNIQAQYTEKQHAKDQLAKIDYFDLLELPKIFDLNNALITKQYLKQMAKVKNDHNGNILMSHLNGASEALKNPYLRGKMLLISFGVEVNDQILKSSVTMDFLEEVMEVNDKLLNAEDEKKDIYKKQIWKQQDDLVKELSDSFNQKNYKDSLLKLAKLNYIMNYSKYF